MARTIKIDNALEKRFKKQEQKKKTRQLVSYFLIVCEGGKTEPNYFRSFPKQVGKVIYDIEFGGGGISTLKVVEEAIERRDKSSQQFDRVWAVFDRDSFDAGDFNSAIQKAAANNIYCAWSNQAFELWYLLHFEYRDTAMDRTEYKHAIEEAVNKKKGKKGEKFKYEKNAPDMFATLKEHGNEEQAIKWAAALNDNHTGEDFANHNPATQVYKLVVELTCRSEVLKAEIIDKYHQGQ